MLFQYFKHVMSRLLRPLSLLRVVSSNTSKKKSIYSIFKILLKSGSFKQIPFFQTPCPCNLRTWLSTKRQKRHTFVLMLLLAQYAVSVQISSLLVFPPPARAALICISCCCRHRGCNSSVVLHRPILIDKYKFYFEKKRAPISAGFQ